MTARRKVKVPTPSIAPAITLIQRNALMRASRKPLVRYMGFWRQACELGPHVETFLPTEIEDLASRGLLKIMDGYTVITHAGRMAI